MSTARPRRVLVTGAASGIGLEASLGPPGRVRPSRRALDPVVAARLWEASERLTGVRYEWSTARAQVREGLCG